MATRAVVAALRMPDWVIRAIVGAPVEVEGAQMSPTAQLLITLERFVPRADPQAVPDLVVVRRDFDIVSSVLLAGVGRDVQVHDTVVAGAHGPVPARVYSPPGAPAMRSGSVATARAERSLPPWRSGVSTTR
ncbi:hypothetical protein ADK67_41825 [Saccharothrix sp. NRRL B-16348]|nr:hypothetical protein ADK67_41825 [Saccharothrix sp. NRRL B-16348]